MLKIAVDIGFRSVKGLTSSGKTIEFPSAVSKFQPVELISDTGNDSASSLAIGYNKNAIL